MLDLPGRGLGYAKTSTKFDAGDPLLGLGHVVHGPKPGAQGQLGRSEDRPGDRGCLPTTGSALKQTSALHQAMGLSAACGALETIWPPKSDDNRATLILAPVLALECGFAEALLELHCIASHQIVLPRPPCSWFVPDKIRLRKMGNQEKFSADVDVRNPAVTQNTPPKSPTRNKV